MSDAVGTSNNFVYEEDMVMNPTLDILSDITRDGWNLRRDNRILLYLNIPKNVLCARRAFQGEHDVIEMIYPTNISDFVD